MLVVEGEEQVTLQVKIAEVQREAMKQLGYEPGRRFSERKWIGLAVDPESAAGDDCRRAC